MAGLGTSPFGSAPLGAAPTLPLKATIADPLASARYFEQKNKTFPLDARGKFLPAHWVDQDVVLALRIRKGSVPSDVDLGHELHKIRHITRLHIERVTQEIKRTLSRLIDRGVVVIEFIDIIVRGYTTFAVVDYTNVVTTKRVRTEVPLA